MKILLLATLGLMAILATSVLAGPPINGAYFSVDLGGNIKMGHGSESWPENFTDGSWGQIGNTLQAKSWDGAALGGQWEVSCISLCVDPILMNDNLDANQTGYQTWRNDYCGGRLWMNGLGESWDGGDVDYWADIVNFVSYTTYQYYEGVIVGTIANISMTAVFDGYDTCMEFVIANATGLGYTDIDGDPLGTLPPDFPSFMSANCSETGSRGVWGDISSVTVIITGCSTSTTETSWSQLKSLYR